MQQSSKYRKSFFLRERYEYPIYRRATWTCNPNPNNLTFSVSLSYIMIAAHSSDFFIFHRDDLLITAVVEKIDVIVINS